MKAFYYSKLIGDAALAALIGIPADHIVDAFPAEVLTFPLVIYLDDNQEDMEYADNKATMSRARVTIHIFTKSDMATTTSIAMEIARIFNASYFNCGTNGEVPDPNPDVRHRVMRFSRELFASDIL
jgi:hypothetical protein